MVTVVSEQIVLNETKHITQRKKGSLGKCSPFAQLHWGSILKKKKGNLIVNNKFAVDNFNPVISRI